jgi:hypothetical protein
MYSRDFEPRGFFGAIKEGCRGCNDGDIKKAVIAGTTAIKTVKATFERGEARMLDPMERTDGLM